MAKRLIHRQPGKLSQDLVTKFRCVPIGVAGSTIRTLTLLRILNLHPVHSALNALLRGKRKIAAQALESIHIEKHICSHIIEAECCHWGVRITQFL
jgi:hypothetical protein